MLKILAGEKHRLLDHDLHDEPERTFHPYSHVAWVLRHNYQIAFL